MSDNILHTPSSDHDAAKRHEYEIRCAVRSFFKSGYGKEFYDYFLGEICGENYSCFDTDPLRMANKAGKREIALYLRNVVEANLVKPEEERTAEEYEGYGDTYE